MTTTHTIGVGTDARAARVQAIRDGALVRAALGQAAGYIYVDGRHQVTLVDRATRTVNTYTGDTLAEAIGAARRGEGYR